MTFIEAAKQALEYLDSPASKLWPAGTQYKIITDLRTAIAEAEKQEPVAAQHRFRHPQKTMPDWSPWQPTTVANRPSWDIDSQGYEVEYRNLYTAPPAAQPERVVFPTMLRKMWSGGEVQAWLDENVNKEKT